MLNTSSQPCSPSSLNLLSMYSPNIFSGKYHLIVTAARKAESLALRIASTFNSFEVGSWGILDPSG
jgi:hypothetical protein